MSTLAEKYWQHLDKLSEETATFMPILPPEVAKEQKEHLRVGIVGGGMAGLYSAMLLKELELLPNVSVKIFAATERVGGRVYTHRFSEEEYQYFEAGAMRLPEVSWQKPVFDLIACLNRKLHDFPID